MSTYRILLGDCRETLQELPEGSVQTVVTSPPYYGLRDYGTAEWEGGDPACDHLGPPKASDSSGLNHGRGRALYEDSATVPYRDTCAKCGARRIDQQIGLEESPDAYVEQMVEVFRAVRRVLREDGTLWLNLGDSYAGSWGAQSRGGPPSDSSTLRGNGHIGGGPKAKSLSAVQIAAAPKRASNTGSIRSRDLKPKDLCMIPARVALALQADGWWLRSDIIWHKPNPMPESVTDRPTSSYEHVFLLAKSGTANLWRARDTGEWSYGPDLSERLDDDFPRWRGFDYFYDAEAIAEESTGRDAGNGFDRAHRLSVGGRGGPKPWKADGAQTRNARNVWTITTKPYAGAHFATFPPELAERCVLAGSRPGDTVLDPFAGSGTTGMVATGHGRKAILCELNPEYAELIRERCGPMLEEAA